MFAPSTQLRLRRFARISARVAVPLVVFTSLLDHAGLFGYAGNDWRRFDGKTVTVSRVIDDQSFECDAGIVRLLGIASEHERTTSFSESNLTGRKIVLRLDVPRTRDAAGELLAYAYLSPSDCWNVDLVLHGSADADRQSNCAMLPQLIAAEAVRDRAIYRKAKKAQS